MIARVMLVLALVAVPLQAIDDAARLEAQSVRRPWLESPMHFASDGARPLLIAGAVVAAVSGVAGRAFVVETAVALVPVNLVVEAVKWAVDRPRPDGSHRRTNAAFPSSHAANAFAVAWVLARRWRRAAWVAFPYAAFVAVSRMYLNRHWLSDVVAGAAIGVVLAWWSVGTWRAWRARGSAAGAGSAPRSA